MPCWQASVMPPKGEWTWLLLLSTILVQKFENWVLSINSGLACKFWFAFACFHTGLSVLCSSSSRPPLTLLSSAFHLSFLPSFFQINEALRWNGYCQRSISAPIRKEVTLLNSSFLLISGLCLTLGKIIPLLAHFSLKQSSFFTWFLSVTSGSYRIVPCSGANWEMLGKNNNNPMHFRYVYYVICIILFLRRCTL